HQTYAYLLGSPAARQAELSKAESYFQKASTLKGASADVWVHLANVQCELGKYRESLDSLETALRQPTLTAADRPKALQAMEIVKSKMGSRSSASSAPISAPASTPMASAVNSPATAANSNQSWQNYVGPSNSFTMRYPDGWTVSTDPKTGRIDAADTHGA